MKENNKIKVVCLIHKRSVMCMKDLINRVKQRPETFNYDCAIIGGGPGGLVSALYLGRFQRSVALVQLGTPRAAWIPKTHNLIGYNRGISGKLLLKRLQAQMQGLKIDLFSAMARVKIDRHGFQIEMDDRRIIRARTVILATGITDNEPQLDNWKELRTKGLLRYCSICDGYEYRKKPIAILAQDDSGIQKGLFIRHWTKNIRFFIPDDLKLAPQRVIDLKEINAKVSRCTSLKIIPRARPEDGVDLILAQKKPIYACAVYVELGCKVNDFAFEHIKKLRRSKEGFLITTTEQRTSIPGLFAVGDCVNQLGQISVAAGQASVAATTIHNDLLSKI